MKEFLFKIIAIILMLVVVACSSAADGPAYLSHNDEFNNTYGDIIQRINSEREANGTMPRKASYVNGRDILANPPTPDLSTGPDVTTFAPLKRKLQNASDRINIMNANAISETADSYQVDNPYSRYEEKNFIQKLGMNFIPQAGDYELANIPEVKLQKENVFQPASPANSNWTKPAQTTAEIAATTNSPTATLSNSVECDRETIMPYSIYQQIANGSRMRSCVRYSNDKDLSLPTKEMHGISKQVTSNSTDAITENIKQNPQCKNYNLTRCFSNASCRSYPAECHKIMYFIGYEETQNTIDSLLENSYKKPKPSKINKKTSNKKLKQKK